MRKGILNISSKLLAGAFVMGAVVLSAHLNGTATAEPKLGDQQTVCSGNVVPINSLQFVLYKSENIHGGRGPSFLVQNEAERTNKRVIEIRNARCEPIGSFGLFATDQPYGSRYYQATGGSNLSAEELYNKASEVGSSNILIEGVNGKWIRVQDPRAREGTINK